MRILVFLHGTSIMHASAEARPRAERVAQVRAGEPDVADFASYVPTDLAVERLTAWARSGAELAYLSSHRDVAGVEADRAVLQRHGFPAGEVFFRLEGEAYADVAARARPDVIVEDDCESIGGMGETTGSQLTPELRARVAVVVVPEFGGLAHLPDDPSELPTLSVAGG